MRPLRTSEDAPWHPTKSSLHVLSLVSPASVIPSTVLYQLWPIDFTCRISEPS